MTNRLDKITVPTLVFLLILSIFYRWFWGGVLAGGDWPYLYPQGVLEVVPLSSWDLLFNNGMGQSAFPKIWFDAYSLLIVKLAQFLPWGVFERLVWFFPYIVVSFFASYFLGKKMNLSSNFACLAGVIYSLNTYIFMVVSGGQAGVFTAYAFMPVVFYGVLSLFENFTFRRSLILSLCFSILMLLDLRVGYMFLFALFLFTIVNLTFYPKGFIKKVMLIFTVPGVVAFLLHIFWIGPILIMRRNPAVELTDVYTSSSTLDFFSFARLENAISLLHPNWPDNIFGKVAFLRPEFLITPIIVFVSLLFVEKEKKSRKLYLLSFMLLALFGIFLAKGTNDPFGEIYRTAFNVIPGFVMFRDPTKWYMLIAVSFSVLIPYSLSKLTEIFVNLKFKKAELIVCAVFLIFWAFIMQDAVSGKVKGTFYPRQIPSEFSSLAEKISNDKEFYRTLWVPTYPTLAYVSNTHPAIPGIEFFKATSLDNLLNNLEKGNNITQLQYASVKYVILPEDIYGRIFVNDRKYDDNVYKRALDKLEKNSNIKEVGRYGKNVVFEIKNPKQHFWLENNSAKVNYKYVSPTEYILDISNVKKGDRLIFSETFDKFWEAKNDKFVVGSAQFGRFNSFSLPKEGTYQFRVIYKPQAWLNMGLFISGACLLIVAILIIKIKDKKI